MRLKYFIFLGLLLVMHLYTFANGDTSRVILKKQPKLMAVDELSNIYIVDKRNNITKYDEHLDSVANFQIAQNGPVSSIDVSDPFRVLVYYTNFNKLIILDRMLSVQNTIDLKLLHIHQPTAVATSKDGGFWVYDYSQNKLLKYDRQLALVAESNDLRIALGVSPKFDILLERQNELWGLSDDNHLYMFTRYGELVNHFKLDTDEPILSLQRVENQLIYATNSQIFVQKLDNNIVNTINLPQDGKKLKQVIFTYQYIYQLNDEGVLIWKQ